LADYTNLTKQEAGEILALYGVSNLEELTALSLGISNSNYKVVAAGKSYLLKVSNDKDQKELEQEQDILNIIKEAGYEYSLKPYQCLNKKSVYEFKEFFGVLFPFIEGIPPGPSDTTCYEIGLALAKLHSLELTGKKEQVRQASEVGFGSKEVLEYINSENAEQVFVDNFLEAFPDKLKGISTIVFPSGIIHGDLYYDNTLFQNDHIYAVLDFEQAGWADYIFDIGISISGTCLEKGRIIYPLINSFMKGYESIRTLNEDEKRYLNDAIIFGLYSIALWRIKRFTEGDLNPLMADSYKELLLRAQAFKASL
jgi:homoserine kinase type II